MEAYHCEKSGGPSGAYAPTLRKRDHRSVSQAGLHASWGLHRFDLRRDPQHWNLQRLDLFGALYLVVDRIDKQSRAAT